MIGEELGFLGSLALILLYVLFLVVGFRMTGRSKDLFLNLYAKGLTLVVVLQALINMMVATGVIPTKGLPLPFVSYGGSSLMASMLAVGLLLGIDRKLNRPHRGNR
jgi:cell division protein FtsW